jgi:hypothetical protein
MPCPPELPSIVRVADNCWLPPDGGPPVAMDFSEDCVLTAFLARPCWHLPELVRHTGVNHAHKVLARLTTKYGGRFATAIRRPGKRGQGGYHVRVQK